MKIIGIDTAICDAFRTNWVFVRVRCDDGPDGIGEATLEYREPTVAQAVKELERQLIGQDPANIEALTHAIYRDAYWRGGPVLMSALSAIEMALWDIKGKTLNVPVYQLLGGQVRDRIRCYANGWFAGAREPKEFARKAEEAVAQGWQALKWDPFGSCYRSIDAATFARAMKIIQAVRNAVGDGIELLIEGHGRFDVPTAIRIGRALVDFDIKWFEEPVPPDDLDALSQVAEKVPVTLSAGERLYIRRDFLRLIQSRAVGFIQPDVSHAGGILELKKIAAMAEACHLAFCPHNPSGPVANAATLQLAACCGNFHIHETMSSDLPIRWEISNEKVRMVDGCMMIPDAPGLGIELDWDRLSKYPYQPHSLRHYVGTLTDIRPTDARPLNVSGSSSRRPTRKTKKR